MSKKIIESEFTCSRKFRWSIEGSFPVGKFGEILLHGISSRPLDGSFSMNFYNDGQYGLEDLYKVLEEFLKHDIKTKKWVCNLGKAILKLYSARGQCVEKYLLENIGCQSCHWGELDFSSNNPTFMEVNWRYQKCRMLDLSLHTSGQTIEDLSKLSKVIRVSQCLKPETNITIQTI